MAGEERFIDFETRLAHQEQTILELGEEIYRQQKQLVQLEQTCAHLLERIRAIAESGGPGDAGPETPPHY